MQKLLFYFLFFIIFVIKSNLLLGEELAVEQEATFTAAPQALKIAVIGALDEEIKSIKNEMIIKEEIKLGNFIFYRGELAGIENKEIILVKSGIGKVNAAICATLLISNFDPNFVIFTGVAGGIDEKIKIGDIIISEDVVCHDFGKVTPEGFTHWKYFDDKYGIEADKYLLNLATQTLRSIKFGELPKELSGQKRTPKIHVGRITTGDQFIAANFMRLYLKRKFKAAVVEMEGVAVAYTCHLFNKPFLIIRVVSDLADEKAEVDFEKFCKYVAPLSTQIIKEIIKKL